MPRNRRVSSDATLRTPFPAELSRGSQIALFLLTLANLTPHLGHAPAPTVTITAFALLYRLGLFWGLLSFPRGPIAPLALLSGIVTTAVAMPCTGLDRGAGLMIAGLGFWWLSPLTPSRAMAILLSLIGLVFLRVFSPNTDSLIAVSLVDLLLLSSLLYQIHYPQGSTQFLPSLVKSAAKMSLAIVLGLATLIAFFPKVSLNLFAVHVAASIGFGSGTELSPGDIASLASSERPAFRVRFPGALPPLSALYWRGSTLSLTDDGVHWFRSSAELPVRPGQSSRTDWARPVVPEPGTENVPQDILLEPRFEHVLFALDSPVALAARSAITPLFPEPTSGRTYLSRDLLDQETLYRAVSTPSPWSDPLTPLEQRQYLQIPPALLHGDHRVLDLARAIGQGTNAATGAEELAHRTLDFFRNNFKYRLDPGELRKTDALAQFLFEKRAGFCGHFAASFATLLRLMGVPSRLVMGFHGGELNEFDGSFLVRDRDAHAWAEIWSAKDQRWHRFDPTSVVAPLRLELGAQGYADRSAHTPAWLVRLREWNLAWDALSTEWKFHRLGGTTTLFRSPRDRWKTWLLLGTLLFVILVPLGVWLVARRRRSPRRDELVELYERFCDVLSKLGVRRRANEGPFSYLARVETRLPGLAGLPGEFTRRYVELRYAKVESPERRRRELRHLLRAVRRHARAPRAG